jgi:2-C-methyl-D-erythritol 4-phosphate cytidylyltransferase
MSAQTTVASIVLAAGSGTRFGHSMNKVWLQLNGKHIISRSLENSRANFSNVRSILVINPDDEQFAREALIKDGALANTEIVHGGATRHESEYKALQYLKRDIEAGLIDLVLIHDGARPLATPELFVAIADGAQTHGGAIPTIALDAHEMDTARDETVARVQTPQGFRATQLLQAYEKAAVAGFVGTDTAACMEGFFPEVKTVAVPGDIFNIKITYPQDLAIAELLIPVQ